MRHLTSTGKTARSRSRGALGLFVAVWLNLALAPCAMANQADDDHDCPHCPPAEEMQGHHGKHAGMEVEAPCADGLADCSLDGEYSHDVRNGKSKQKDIQHELPAFVMVDELVTPAGISHRQRAPPPIATAHPGASPPLHLLNCVFLI